MEKLGVHYSDGALKEIMKQTLGYAYFLQEWGKHVWDIAETSNYKLPKTRKMRLLMRLQTLMQVFSSSFRPTDTNAETLS